MGKIEKSWSGMRHYLEKDMLAPSLKGRVRYNCTTYVGMDGCHIFEIYIDGSLKKQFSWETVNSYFIQDQRLGDADAKKKEKALPHYWDDFWQRLEKTPITERAEYTDEEFCDALALYRNQSITKSMDSEHPLVRLFAILDRRIGKRTLERVKETITGQPEWLESIYKMRMDAMRL